MASSSAPPHSSTSSSPRVPTPRSQDSCREATVHPQRQEVKYFWRHRWVTSGVFQSSESRSGDSLIRKSFANFTVSPIIEVASGRPFTVLTGTDFLFDFSGEGGRPSVGSPGVSSPFIPGKTFTLPNVCQDNSGASFSIPVLTPPVGCAGRSEEHTSELQSRLHLVCRLLLEK